MKIAKLIWTLLFAGICTMSAAQELGPKDGLDLPSADLERVGIGASAPDFTLVSKDKDLVALSSFTGNKNVVLVFYRGFW
jgi:hypothetical protein